MTALESPKVVFNSVKNNSEIEESGVFIRMLLRTIITVYYNNAGQFVKTVQVNLGVGRPFPSDSNG